MMVLVTGTVGIVLLAIFLGIMLWWVPAPPLIIIMVGVMLLLIWDVVQTVRYGENGSRR
jgi:O-antigen/teichoic acid export membrane protein